MNGTDVITCWGILTTLAFFGIIWLIPTLNCFWMDLIKETSDILSKLTKLENENKNKKDIFEAKNYKAYKKKLKAIEDLCTNEAVQQFKNERKKKVNMGLNPKRSEIFCAKVNCETVFNVLKGKFYFYLLHHVPTILFSLAFALGICPLIGRIPCYNFYCDYLWLLALLTSLALFIPLVVSVIYLAIYKPGISYVIIIKHLRGRKLYLMDSLSHSNRLIRKKGRRR